MVYDAISAISGDLNSSRILNYYKDAEVKVKPFFKKQLFKNTMKRIVNFIPTQEKKKQALEDLKRGMELIREQLNRMTKED